MDHFQGITVDIVSNGQVLKLYEDPDAAETEDGRSRHQYVEAVAESTFQVRVNLTNRFNLYNIDPEHAVYIGLEIDGRDGLVAFHPTKKYLQEQFSLGRSCNFAFTGPKDLCKETGQWMLSDYSFANLVLKEASDPEFSVKQAQNLGRLQLTVQGVRRVKCKVPHLPSGRTAATINEVPEKALKGRPIDATVGSANARPTSRPSSITMRDKSISGEAGRPVVFNIYYRSRRALQMMGCIPRSPSPEPKDKKPPKATADVAQEVQDLRARLALLERSLDVKPESSPSSSSSARPGLKREREEDDQGNERTRQRPRTSAKIEHVDLTGD